MSFLAPRASSSKLPMQTRFKSSKKPSSPSLAATRIPVANPARLSKPKQMKVFLLEDLKDFGKKGEIITANRTHATTLFHSHSGLPITQTFKNQPSLSLPSTPSISSALHSPSVSAALAELVPGFKYFSERTKEEGREQKGGRDVWAKGLPRATTMQRVLRERGVRREEEDKEVRSLRGETL